MQAIFVDRLQRKVTLISLYIIFSQTVLWVWITFVVQMC